MQDLKRVYVAALVTIMIRLYIWSAAPQQLVHEDTGQHTSDFYRLRCAEASATSQYQAVCFGAGCGVPRHENAPGDFTVTVGKKCPLLYHILVCHAVEHAWCTRYDTITYM
jgi:hypothetical protein